MNLPAYHTNADGTVPCTNCGDNIKPTNMSDSGWMHIRDDGRPLIRCYVDGPQWACPEAANDCDPDFYDERGWARE